MLQMALKRRKRFRMSNVEFGTAECPKLVPDEVVVGQEREDGHVHHRSTAADEAEFDELEEAFPHPGSLSQTHSRCPHLSCGHPLPSDGRGAPMGEGEFHRTQPSPPAERE